MDKNYNKPIIDVEEINLNEVICASLGNKDDEINNGAIRDYNDFFNKI